MTETTSTAVAKRDNGPGALIKQYKNDFATVLPAHLKADTWVRVAQGLLRRDQQLARAAAQNPGSFLSALLECARLGLEPGDTFHLVPIGGEIVGISDYTGEIELIYRAGAVASIKAEVVHSNDVFEYNPDAQRPHHKVDWFGERGDLIGAYAYAEFKDGSTSRVVVMSKADIEKVKAVNKASSKPGSPWQKWPDRMYLKTVVKQLAKWVPSSPDYREHALRSAAAASETQTALPAPNPAEQPADDQPDRGTITTANGDVIEAELVDDDSEYLGQVDAEHDQATAGA